MFRKIALLLRPESRTRKNRNAGASRPRGLAMESLEQRQMLSVSPAGCDDLFDHEDVLIVSSVACPGCAIPEVSHDFDQEGAEAAPAEVADAALAPLEETFLLHSNPGAKCTIYLDFDGHETVGTYWNSAQFPTIVTPSYSLNNLQRIQYIWQRVAEDFIAFDVDVTTEDPGDAALIKTTGGDTAWGIRVAIGGSCYDWLGDGAGGIAYLGSFSWDTDTPCFIFTDNLGSEKSIAEAISHEVGHTLGLSHDGEISTGQGYHEGANGWAPIMGVGYYQPVVQWSKGTYFDADNQEDDLAIITGQRTNAYTARFGGNGFSYRADDHGNARRGSAKLGVTDGIIYDTGIIERNTDVDFFQFDVTTAGILNIEIVSGMRDANLDVLSRLYSATGTVLYTSDPLNSMNASFENIFLGVGTYYVSVEGTGKIVDGQVIYTDYGSIGSYTITGNIALAPSSAIPKIIDVTSLTYDSLTLTWEAISGLEGYRLEYRQLNEAGWTIWTPDPEADATTATITGLETNTFYFLRLTAIYPDGSERSVEVFCQTSLIHLDPPEGVTITEVTEDTITLTWEPVENAAGYELWYKTEESLIWTVQMIKGGDTTSYTIRYLTPDSLYMIQLRAVYGASYSDWATVPDTRTLVATPISPRGFISTGKTSDSISLAWDWQADVAGYKLEYRKSSETELSVWPETLAPDATSVTITGLDVNTTYRFWLTPYNVSGSAVSMTIASTKVTAPVSPMKLITTHLGSESISLAWDAQAHLDSYKLEYQKEGDTSWTLYTPGPEAHASTFTIPYLEPNTTYNIRLTATNVSGSAVASLTAKTDMAYNAREITLITLQELADSATWEQIGGEYRLIAIDAAGKDLSGPLALTDCTELRTVSLGGNRLASLDISGCTVLTYLDCSDNELQWLDVSGCVALENLLCHANALAALDVTMCENLETLSCSSNRLAAIDLSGSARLAYLFCDSNQLSLLDVSGCGELLALACDSNDLTFATLPNLVGGGVAFSYAPQGEFAISPTLPKTFRGVQSQFGAQGGTTTYIWRNADTDYAITSGIDEDAGVFVFDNSLTGTQVYCEMTNTLFPGLTLRTNVATIEIILPTMPTSLRVPNVAPSEVTLTWGPSINATGYELWYQVAEGGGEWTKADLPGDATISCVVKGLMPDTAYVFQLRGVNDIQGSYSPWISRTVTTAVAPLSGVITTAPSASATPRSEAAIHEWQSFTFEVWANTQFTDTATIELAYDADLFVPVMENGEVKYEAPLGVTLELGGAVRNAETGLTECTIIVTLDERFVWQEQSTSLVSLAFTPALAAADGSAAGVPANQISRQQWLSVNNLNVATDVLAVPYDLNDDGVIDIYDLIQFAKTYGNSQAQNSEADFNGDGVVDIYDLIQLAKVYGGNTETAAAAIPAASLAAAAQPVAAPTSVVIVETVVEEIVVEEPAVDEPVVMAAALPVAVAAEEVAVVEEVAVAETVWMPRSDYICQLPVLRQPEIAVITDVQPLRWFDYDSAEQTDAAIQFLAESAQTTAAPREIVESLFAETGNNVAVEDLAELGAAFYRAGVWRKLLSR